MPAAPPFNLKERSQEIHCPAPAGRRGRPGCLRLRAAARHRLSARRPRPGDRRDHVAAARQVVHPGQPQWQHHAGRSCRRCQRLLGGLLRRPLRQRHLARRGRARVLPVQDHSLGVQRPARGGQGRVPQAQQRPGRAVGAALTGFSHNNHIFKRVFAGAARDRFFLSLPGNRDDVSPAPRPRPAPPISARSDPRCPPGRGRGTCRC